MQQEIEKGVCKCYKFTPTKEVERERTANKTW